MYRWYQNADICYAYLSDVSIDKNSTPEQKEQAFKQSRWFTRGWTLQELLAPRSMKFFSRGGKLLGERSLLEHGIHDITGIPIEALQGGSLRHFDVEERLCWAANRVTSIEEDQVYCLLGMFEISMAPLYGETKARALERFKRELNGGADEGQSSTGDMGYLLTPRKQRMQQSQAPEILQMLRTSQYEQFKNEHLSRFDHTCQWIFQHRHFQKWQDANSGPLWISADPGWGKSVFARSFIDEESTSSSHTVCYFFFRDNEDQKHINTALCAILHQLFSRKEQLIQHAIQEHRVEGENLIKSFYKLWGIFLKTTSDPRAGRVICVFDALDECAEADRHDFIQSLNAFYKGNQIGSRLKILITGRPYLNIERKFATITRDYPNFRLRGEKESIAKEIELVIKERVSELKEELDLDDLEQSILQEKLLAMENRTYLWLTLIIEVIRDEVGLTRRKLDTIVDTLPKTVNEAYEAILKKSKDQKKARKLLYIVVGANRPLNLKEMNIALALENGHRALENLDLEKQSTFDVTVRNLCGLFVHIINQKVYLIHQTAKEFLINREETKDDGWNHSLPTWESQLLMAKICITYLSFDVFATDELLDYRRGLLPPDLLVQGHDFLDYAAIHWTGHFKEI